MTKWKLKPITDPIVKKMVSQMVYLKETAGVNSSFLSILKNWISNSQHLNLFLSEIEEAVSLVFYHP